MRVMDDLPRQVDRTIRELLSGLVRVLNSTLDPIAETELLGQTDGYVAGSQGVLLSFEKVDEVPGVVGIQFGLDLGFQPETFPKIRGFPSSVWGVGLHIPMSGGGGFWLPGSLHRRVRHTLNLVVANR